MITTLTCPELDLGTPGVIMLYLEQKSGAHTEIRTLGMVFIPAMGAVPTGTRVSYCPGPGMSSGFTPWPRREAPPPKEKLGADLRSEVGW